MVKRNLAKMVEQFEKNYPADKIEKANKLHEEFLQKFPLERLQNLRVEEYALGKEKGSLCWWLEYNTDILGSIKGGNARKLIIYYSVKNNEWKYPKQFNSLDEAWSSLRSEIISVIDSCREKPYQPIEEGSLLYRANMLKGKLLYLYHPDKFLPIYSMSHLHHYLRQLNVPEEKWQGKDNIECNLLLKDTIYSMELFKDWPPIKVQDFLCNTMLKQNKCYKLYFASEGNYLDELKDTGYVFIEDDGIGDLTNYPDYEEFIKAYQENISTETGNVEKAKELWRFYNLQPGDRILIFNGKKHILAEATVTEKGYEFRGDLEQPKHIIYANWGKIFDPPREIERQEDWRGKNLVEITEKRFNDLINKDSTVNPVFPYQEENFFARLEQALERKEQCILYGPPGTGKTYLARRYIKWRNSKDNLDQYPDSPSPKTWMMIASSRQEDFQWEEILNDSGTVDFSLRNIINNFKKAQKGDKVLCYRGGVADRAFVGIAEVQAPLKDDALKIKGVRLFKNPIEFDRFKNDVEYKTSQAGRMGNRGTMFEVGPEFEQLIINYLYEDGDYESAKLLLETAQKNNFEMCTFHPSFNYEDFIEGYKPVEDEHGKVSFQLEKGLFVRLCERAREHSESSFYLIIDEINRGNIPKIFGEIMTLLEKDKRGIEVILPQSKESFTIPDNLYIIATMNTADRSIKIMDAALKRRFAFMECMPDLSLINGIIDELNMSPGDILKELNRRLVDFGGRDKQIGHAYFMENGQQLNSVEELKEIFELEIIPLVQEYCFDDYQQLAEIIGSGFVDSDEMAINTQIFQETEEFILEINNSFAGNSA